MLSSTLDFPQELQLFITKDEFIGEIILAKQLQLVKQKVPGWNCGRLIAHKQTYEHQTLKTLSEAAFLLITLIKIRRES